MCDFMIAFSSLVTYYGDTKEVMELGVVRDMKASSNSFSMKND